MARYAREPLDVSPNLDLRLRRPLTTVHSTSDAECANVGGEGVGQSRGDLGGAGDGGVGAHARRPSPICDGRCERTCPSCPCRRPTLSPSESRSSPSLWPHFCCSSCLPPTRA